MIIYLSYRCFVDRFGFLSEEESIEYYAILGGLESFDIVIDDISLEALVQKLLLDCIDLPPIDPTYLTYPPYAKLLRLLAIGDAKASSTLRRASVGEEFGGELLEELCAMGVLRKIKSRESPLRVHPKQKLKKELRSYRIEDKYRFVKPYHRFWFGFIYPFADEIAQGRVEAFWRKFHQDRQKLSALVFEELCLEAMRRIYPNAKVVESFWDQYSEYDLLIEEDDGRVILGECKYKQRSVGKGELLKLQSKAATSKLNVKEWILFAKDTFSKELRALNQEDLKLYTLEDILTILER